MTKKELLQKLEHFPDEAAVGITECGTIVDIRVEEGPIMGIILILPASQPKLSP